MVLCFIDKPEKTKNIVTQHHIITKINTALKYDTNKNVYHVSFKNHIYIATRILLRLFSYYFIGSSYYI